MTHEIRLGAEAGAVVEPIALHRGGGEVFLLLLECLLLAVRAVERVDAREELLGDRLRDVPRRISEDCVKAGARLAEYVRKLELSVEEAHLGRDPGGYGPRLVRGSVNVLGSGAQSISSAGQNQQAHQRSIPRLSERHAGDPRRRSR